MMRHGITVGRKGVSPDNSHRVSAYPKLAAAANFDYHAGMFYRRLADLVLVLHALVALFFLFGVVAVKLLPWLALVHIPLVLWVSAAYVMGS